MVPVIQDEGCDTAGLPKLRTLYNPQDWSQLLATPNDHSCTSDPLITTPASKGSSSCWKSKLILEAFHAAQAVTGCPTSIHQAAPRAPAAESGVCRLTASPAADLAMLGLNVSLRYAPFVLIRTHPLQAHQTKAPMDSARSSLTVNWLSICRSRCEARRSYTSGLSYCSTAGR